MPDSPMLEHWTRANTDTLRNDPQGRSWSVVMFEAKGYVPRKPGNIFEPINWVEND